MVENLSLEIIIPEDYHTTHVASLPMDTHILTVLSAGVLLKTYPVIKQACH